MNMVVLLSDAAKQTFFKMFIITRPFGKYRYSLREVLPILLL